MRIHSLIAAALLVAAPAALEAQFTTLVPPQRDPQPAQAARVDTEQRARADSLRRTQLSDMRAWVDSAAVAIDAAVDTAADTLIQVDSGEVVRERPMVPEPQPTTEFREGAPAPATATGLPTLALLGIGMLGIGAMLVGRPRG